MLIWVFVIVYYSEEQGKDGMQEQRRVHCMLQG
jgi:hypothetical protein